MVSVNKFFVHWIKEIQKERLGDDLQIIPNLLVDICIYCDNMPKKRLKIFQENLFQKKELLFQVVTLENNITTQQHL